VALKTLVGRESEELHIFEAEELSVDPGSPRVNVSTDGEVTIMDTPLQFRIRPGALAVVTPKRAAHSVAD
jgi:diacylglycerol kinase family enzyme